METRLSSDGLELVRDARFKLFDVDEAFDVMAPKRLLFDGGRLGGFGMSFYREPRRRVSFGIGDIRH